MKGSGVFERILVTGATGFLGKHLVPALRLAFPRATIMPVSRQDYDLLDPAQVNQMLRDTRPDTVVHLAAKVGGILANRNYPAEFLYENLMINTQTFHACYRAGVGKFLTLIGGCSYPATAVSPIGEDQMWNGYPQPESAAYSVAKKMILVQSEAYRRQYGFNSVVLIPGNVYGEYDNFNLEYAHVIPALIRRFVEASEQGASKIVCFGSGRPRRDFVYAGDVARLIPRFLRHYNSGVPVNISSGTAVSISELAELLRSITGFAGRITWDPSKPDGQMEKIFGVTALRRLGLSCSTPLEVGLRRTVDWFVQARREGTVRL